MITTKKIKIPIFGQMLVIVLFDNYEHFNSKFKKFNLFVKDYDAFVIDDTEDQTIYICFSQYKHKKTKIQHPTPGIVAHESKHVVNSILKFINQKPDLENDELECYLLGWVVDKVYTEINNRNNK